MGHCTFVHSDRQQADGLTKKRRGRSCELSKSLASWDPELELTAFSNSR